MTSVPPTQPPAAPETDVNARSLTHAVLLHYGYTLDEIEAAENVHPGLMCTEEQCFDEESGDSVHGQVHDELGAMASVMVDVVVPRIDAALSATRERVRVVEGERDAAREKAEWWERTCTYWNEQATEAQRFRDMNAARAESAEAAHEALRERLTSVVASLQAERPCGDACRAAEVASALLAGSAR